MGVKTFNEYQVWCETTAVFHEGFAIPYIALKLNGELAELSEKLTAPVKSCDYTDIRKEIGDCMWYCATLSTRLGTTLNGLYKNDCFVNMEYDIDDMDNVMVKAHQVAGLIAERVGKMLRDRDGVPDWGDRVYLWDKLTELFIFLVSVSYTTAGHPKRVPESCAIEVMNGNIAKLEDRRKRSKLKGSGDER